MEKLRKQKFTVKQPFPKRLFGNILTSGEWEETTKQKEDRNSGRLCDQMNKIINRQKRGGRG